MISKHSEPRTDPGGRLPGSGPGSLVSLALLGDSDAFCALYRELAPRVYRFCRVRVAEASDAEDLTQLTFMKAIEALPRYEDRGLPFAAWLFRIARNVVIDFERTRRDSIDLDAVVRVGGDLTMDRGLAGADERDVLVRAMARLTPDQRDVLAYRFFADLSARETGWLMHRQEATIRALQARALEALRRGFAESIGELDAGASTDAPTTRRSRLAMAALGLLP